MANALYPIFLKAEKLHFLIVGGGVVANEKIGYLLKSSPNAQVTLVAQAFLSDIQQYRKYANVAFIEKSFSEDDLLDKNIVIAATNDPEVNKQIYHLGHVHRLLVNVADTPDFCDFYLGGIVTKGDLKIAISTNGKSPTMAKRIRELLEDVLPDNIDDLLQNMHAYRKTLNLTLEQKVNHLNQLTQNFKYENHGNTNRTTKWRFPFSWKKCRGHRN